ncbi:iron complex transport system permease protein [Pullulanibacillus pueri]|uniref:Iron(3+)-hydroxamate import system permease protein FhuG n=1 Tax=Pullulanibacillus pueri TaxID=1437324 RepID=A0A8J2ZXD2_9BACL|nr:iron ABC transporter permease [Pullulanibacillus pueri]MBM7682841.1 iron complex transport system permease protein [Pullulanibacillus pueri]GGH84260.1 iron(3+)-hydroxamate import system permease protein FhuG [Pullulanibacillus pueri]
MRKILTLRRHPLLVMGVLFFLLIIAFLICLNTGVAKLTVTEAIRTLAGMGSDKDNLILFEFRLPRMVIALLVGAGLAVSGAVLQAITKNEMADPGILGINAGAGLAVILFIFFAHSSLTDIGTLSVYLMPVFALLGAILAATLIYIFAWKRGITPVRLVLVGIGVNAAFNAIIIIFQVKMNPEDFMQATIWLSGSIWGADWRFVLGILPWIILLIPVVLIKYRSLNVMNMGDKIATGLGVKVEKERMILLLLSVALAGACVAVAGNIAFLGLAVPHLARKLVGAEHQVTIPTAALLGALVLLLADMVSKNLMAPSEIPVGLVVSVIAAPYFIYLLMRSN